jgi:hypothetical protein
VFPGVGVGVASRVVAVGSGTGRRRGLPAGARLEHLDVVNVAVLLELEAPPNDWFAGTVSVTRAKRGLCGKPSLAARGMFEARFSLVACAHLLSTAKMNVRMDQLACSSHKLITGASYRSSSEDR